MVTAMKLWLIILPAVAGLTGCATVAERGGVCAKASEVAIGMTSSQVLSLCERTADRTSEVITGGGRHLIIWAYKNGYFEFENGKLVRTRLLTGQ